MSARAEETREKAEAEAPAFSRILLKLSGEALMGDREYGLDHATLEEVAEEIAVSRRGSSPYSRSPISASPESFRRTRWNAGASLSAAGWS